MVPKFAVSATPEILIVPAAVPAAGARPTRDVRVTVVNHSKGAAKAEAALTLPQGWRAEPASQPVAFSREDEAVTVRFTVTPPAGAGPHRAASHLTIERRRPRRRRRTTPRATRWSSTRTPRAVTCCGRPRSPSACST